MVMMMMVVVVVMVVMTMMVVMVLGCDYKHPGGERSSAAAGVVECSSSVC